MIAHTGIFLHIQRPAKGGDRKTALANCKIMTCPLYPDSGLKMLNQIDWTLDTIARESPDIITLQEVDRSAKRRKFDNQSAIISRELAMRYRYRDRIYLENEAVSLTTLSKYPFQSKGKKPLVIPGFQDLTGALGNNLQLDETSRLYLFNVYLDDDYLRPGLKIRNILAKYATLDQVLNDPILISGVFNHYVLEQGERNFQLNFREISVPPHHGSERISAGPAGALPARIFMNGRMHQVDAYRVAPETAGLNPALISVIQLI